MRLWHQAHRMEASSAPAPRSSLGESVLGADGGVASSSSSQRSGGRCGAECEHVAAQLSALALKNLLLLRRRWRSSFLYVLVPSLAVLGLAMTDSLLVPPIFDAEAETAALRVRPCARFSLIDQPTALPCVTAMFAPTTPDTIAIMQDFASSNGLAFGSDVVGEASADAVARKIAGEPGAVGAGGIFLNPYAPDPASSSECVGSGVELTGASGTIRLAPYGHMICAPETNHTLRPLRPNSMVHEPPIRKF